jgi:hypothetical protein
MPCTLISPRHFQVLRMGARLIVQVDPRLEDGHVLALEDGSPNRDDIRLRVLDCDDGEGSPVDAEIESETFLGLDEVALIYEGGMKLVDVEEPAMTAANGGAPHAEPTPDMATSPPTGHGGGGPMFGADRPGADAPPPPPAAPAPGPAAPAPPAPAPAPGDAAPAAPSIGYGVLEVPVKPVVIGKPFAVTVGLSGAFVEGSADKELPRPPGVGDTFKLQIQLQADIDALTVNEGSAWKVELEVTPEQRHPTKDVRLTAIGGTARGVALMAFFSIDGQAIGWMARPISIVAAEGDEAPEAVSPDASELAPPGEHPPDLTIQIADDPNRRAGLLMWVVTVPPSFNVPLPKPEDLRSDIGNDAETFARQVMEGVPTTSPLKLYEKVMGLGSAIADKIPEGVLETYRNVEAALAAKGRVPTVMIHTREPYIPWELAVIDKSPAPGRSPFLGARAAVGRWILPERGKGPAYPPPPQVKIRSMVVVSGDYRGRLGWAGLPEARREAKDLAKEFKARPIDAAERPVLDLLKNKPRAQALHFAIHGKFSPESAEQGMILVDGQIEPDIVRGSVLTDTPFVFLNACQLGAADQMLGDYAGMAQSFLLGGASAVIAPLWNVRDRLARQISLDFYRTVYGSAEQGGRISAGEALRQVRAKFTGQSKNATYLAYQLYGDPKLLLAH